MLRARDSTLRARPADVKAHFTAQFRRLVAPRHAAPRSTTVPTLRPAPDDDPYGF